MSSWEATSCTGMWQRVAGGHKLCSPRLHDRGPPIQPPLPRTCTTQVVPDFQHNIRLSHAIFLALRGRFIASPGRFCIAEAPASEWPFNDTPVPWILPEGYRNPKGTVLDFPGGDSQDEEDSPGKGSGAAPTTISETIGSTAQDDADDEDDEGFETVGDNEEAPG